LGILSILTLPVRKKRLSDVAPGDFEQALSSSAVRPLLFSRKYAILISVQYRGRAPGIAKERISIHKQYWTVRSRPRLFIGLAFTIAGFMLFYTILTVLVLEPEIPWRLFPWGAAASASRFWLLAVPLLSMGCCTLLRYLSRRGGREELWAGENFLLSLLLFFVQLDKLNLAKGIGGSPALVLILLLAAMGGYAFWSLRKKQN
jgi:hypothetical protein